MNRIILVSYLDTKSNRNIKELFTNDYQFRKSFDTFNDLNYENIEILPLIVKGKTYKEKQENARELAIDFQNFNMKECDIDLSILELSEVCNYFEKIGLQFGLLKEFKENALC